MQPAPEPRSAVFTIVSCNYFHYALNLMASVAEHLPGCRRVVAVYDELEGLDTTGLDIELVGIGQLGIAELDLMVVQYAILELNTAIKPFVFNWLLRSARVERVIYFDPDIQLYSGGAELLQRLETSEVVLTPHLTAPLEDDRHPSDLSILQSGTYNLGFLALRRSAPIERMLHWWQRKLARDCVVDIPRGLFTDQKWMDLVPACTRTCISSAIRPGTWRTGTSRIAASTSAKAATRSTASRSSSSNSPATTRTAARSASTRTASRWPTARRWCSSYLPVTANAWTRPAASATPPFPTPSRRWPTARLCPTARGASSAGISTGAARCPRFARLPGPASWSTSSPHRWTTGSLRCRASRCSSTRTAPTCRQHCPTCWRGAARPFLGWFAERAGPEAGIGGVLAGVAASPPKSPPADSGTALPPANPPPPQVLGTATAPATAARAVAGPVVPYRLAYRLAWRARHVLRPMTTVQFRQRMREALLRRAFPSAPPAAGAAAAPVPPAVRLPGVTVIAYLQAESGVGESARATLRTLACTTLPHAVVDFRAGNVSRMGESVDQGLAHGRQYAVSLLHINADQLPIARTLLGEEPFTATYRIGFWAWELENFPAEWHGAFAHVDEVWVPSTFCQRAIAAVLPVPVLVMPHAVEVPARPAADRARFGLRNDSVAFLTMADMMSSAGRKNPFAAVQAFLDAFAHGDAQAELVVKIANPERDPEAFARLQAMAAASPRIRLLGETLDRPVLNSLIDSVDCFVSLHRSEGFGLVIAEAMVRGKVVVATGWSGNMDFMTAHNALPVDFRLVTLQADAGPYRRGERWAEPSHEDAVAKLRQVAADPALRRRLGERAWQDSGAQLSPQAVARLVQPRLTKVLQVRGRALAT
jgi:glycosyltransferase involved in cell wall biosynthesis